MTEVRPFTIDIPDEALDDLGRRIDATRWPDAEPVDDWSHGLPLAYAKELAAHWSGEYDWRAREAYHNRFPQIVTEIDDVTVHAIHARSEHANARPLIISHGWPGSVVEFHKVIEPLIDPESHGGTAADAFHVIAPSLVGYGFSGAASRAGLDAEKMAGMWATLMERLS